MTAVASTGPLGFLSLSRYDPRARLLALILFAPAVCLCVRGPTLAVAWAFAVATTPWAELGLARDGALTAFGAALLPFRKTFGSAQLLDGTGHGRHLPAQKARQPFSGQRSRRPGQSRCPRPAYRRYRRGSHQSGREPR